MKKEPVPLSWLPSQRCTSGFRSDGRTQLVYLHHFRVDSLDWRSAEAAMLDLLALQLHVCCRVCDETDGFLEADGLQNSLSRCALTYILGRPVWFLNRQISDISEILQRKVV